MLDEIAAWQARPLETVYPLVFFDALRIKVRDEGMVRNKAVHIAPLRGGATFGSRRVSKEASQASPQSPSFFFRCASVRRRSALSLMKPAASRWSYATAPSSKVTRS